MAAVGVSSPVGRNWIVPWERGLPSRVTAPETALRGNSSPAPLQPANDTASSQAKLIRAGWRSWERPKEDSRPFMVLDPRLAKAIADAHGLASRDCLIPRLERLKDPPPGTES